MAVFFVLILLGFWLSTGETGSEGNVGKCQKFGSPSSMLNAVKLAAKYQTHMSERIKDEQPDCFNIFNMISISSDFE